MRLLPLLALPFVLTAATNYDDADRGPGIAGDRQGDVTSYRAADFDRVAYGFPGEVDIRVGPAWSVRATGPAAAFANLRVATDRDTLTIEHRYRDRKTDTALERQVHFVVTVPRLAGVALGGSGRMSVDQVRGTAFDAALGGSGSMALGAVAVDRAEISIGGSGAITARGAVRSLKVNLGGSGGLQAPGLRAASAQVSSAGSGTIRATVDGAAQVSVVGSGSVDLGPNARCSVTRMGKAQVRCGS
jgi:hypothetical protein